MDNKQDLKSLVNQVQKGNTEAFGQVYDLLLDKIYRFTYFRVGSKEDAEDLTEQIFIKAWTGLKTYKLNEIPFEAWIFRIARNQVIDHYRTKKSFTSLEEVPNIIDNHASVEEIVERKLDQEVVLKELKTLPVNYQEIIVLKFIEEKDNDEISLALGKPESHVRVLQSRALKALRKKLETKYEQFQI